MPRAGISRETSGCTMRAPSERPQWDVGCTPRRCRPAPMRTAPRTILQSRANETGVSMNLRAPRLSCLSMFLFAWCVAVAHADSQPDARDAALLARMTLTEKINQLMLLSKGTMTGPDSAGRPNQSAEELARNGIGFQMSAFEFSAKDINRIQRIAVKESRLGIPVVFATDIIHGYWTTFPVPLGLAATFDAEDARITARVSGIEGYSHGQRWTFAPMVDHPADPRWGRVVETFGESPLVSSDYAVATIQGFHGALADLPGKPAPADFGVASCL